MKNINAAYVIEMTTLIKAKPGSYRREYLRMQRTRVISRRLRQADAAQIDVPAPGLLAKRSAFQLAERGKAWTKEKSTKTGSLRRL